MDQADDEDAVSMTWELGEPEIGEGRFHVPASSTAGATKPGRDLPGNYVSSPNIQSSKPASPRKRFVLSRLPHKGYTSPHLYQRCDKRRPSSLAHHQIYLSDAPGPPQLPRSFPAFDCYDIRSIQRPSRWCRQVLRRSLPSLLYVVLNFIPKTVSLTICIRSSP